MDCTRIGRRAAVLAAPGTAAAAPAAGAAGLDPAFGGGQVLTPLSPTAGDRYYGATPGPAGSTYSAGFTSPSGADQVFALTKVKADGTLDASFGSGGVATINVSPAPFPAAPDAPNGAAQPAPTGTSETARAVMVQPSGKIVVVGQAETPASSGKPDSRDLDMYAVRFNAGGSLDTTFGSGGITRVDLSDGVQAVTNPSASTLAVNSDQAYGAVVRSDGSIVITGARGVDSATNTTRRDRDLAMVQLTVDGQVDSGFGSAGSSVGRLAGIDENPRNGIIQADGKVIMIGYGGTPTKPVLFRTLADGTPDPAFGANGVATDLGAGASRAEGYGLVQQGDKYVIAAYGSRAESPTNTDAILYRFNGDGTWDTTFGPAGLGGFITYDGGVDGAADRFRNIGGLPDGRIVAIGGTTTTTTPAVATDALIAVFNPDGTLDPSVGTGGVVKVDYGGVGDFFYGLAIDGLRITAAGYLGAANPAGDQSALARVDLSPPAPPVPTPTVGQTPRPTPRAATRKRRTAGKVTIRCTRVGRKDNRIRCVVTQANKGKGKVRLTLKRKGAKKLTGSAKLGRRGKATITIKASRKRGKYTVTLKLPTPAGVTQTVKRTITVR